VPYFTTVAAATAAVAAIEASVSGPFEVCSLQEYHAKTKRPTLLPPV
jgi:hypothetical protein